MPCCENGLFHCGKVLSWTGLHTSLLPGFCLIHSLTESCHMGSWCWPLRKGSKGNLEGEEKVCIVGWMNVFEDKLPRHLSNDQNQLIPEPDYKDKENLFGSAALWASIIRLSPGSVSSGHLGTFTSEKLALCNFPCDPNFPQQALSLAIFHGLVHWFMEVRKAILKWTLGFTDPPSRRIHSSSKV